MYYLLLILCFGGCNMFGGFKPTSQEIISSNWSENTIPNVPNQLYCYKTLGETVCYSNPLPNSENRFVGTQPIITQAKPKTENTIKSTYNKICKKIKGTLP